MRAPAPSLRPMIGAPTDSREVHHLVDLLGEHLAERAAEDGEVLGEDEDLAAVDRAPAGDDAVGERPGVLDAEAVGPVAGEHVELDEGVRVEEQVEPLAGGELAPLVLALRPRPGCPACSASSRSSRELLETLLDRVRDRGDRAAAHRLRPVDVPRSTAMAPGYVGRSTAGAAHEHPSPTARTWPRTGPAGRRGPEPVSRRRSATATKAIAMRAAQRVPTPAAAVDRVETMIARGRWAPMTRPSKATHR